MTKPETKYHNTHQTPPHSRCTPAQQKEVNRINKCGDHYEILGVQRTATKPEIERVFRKVSLKVHPDKNKCPGAEEAFKKLAKARETLIGPPKSNVGGTDEAPKRPEANGSNRTFNEEEFFKKYDEEFFKRHFKAEWEQNDDRQQKTNGTAHRKQRENRQDPQPENTNQNAYYWYIFIGVVILTALYNVSPDAKKSSKDVDTVYSLKSTRRFYVARRTLNKKIRYYVESNFIKRLRGFSLDELEKTIEKEYLQDLERACAEQKSYLFVRQMYAKFKSWITFEEFDEIRLPACNMLKNFDHRFSKLS
ncbi:dnaJ homolog subfamily C member 18-like [Zophobas morio]|uniref:dnaJ homolog subfamily C member 18-like n=1 Tax=Zophobas morio TaxID=2755281 RepID=UPI003083DA18